MPMTHTRRWSAVELPGPLTTLRGVIADPHATYREGLARALRETGIEVIDSGPTAEQAIRSVEETPTDVAIVDLRLADVSGLEATRRLRRTAPATLVFLISVSAAETEIADAIGAGASGYLEKDQPIEEMAGSIRAAAEGKPVMPARIATALLRCVGHRTGAQAAPGDANLSRGELEVLELSAESLGAEQISTVLGLDTDAVHRRTANVLMKLGDPGRRVRRDGQG